MADSGKSICAEFYTLDIRRLYAKTANEPCEVTAAGIWFIKDEWNILSSHLTQLAVQLRTPIEEIIDEQISMSNCYNVNDRGEISLKR